MGTASTCKFTEARNLVRASPWPWSMKKPARQSCWRFAFRYHQQVSKDTNGFMIQVDEFDGLGDGQKIETLMAEQVGLKIFRTFTCIPQFIPQLYYDGIGSRPLQNL